MFALVREAATGLGLLAISLYLAGFNLPLAQDAPRIILVGFCLFANQLFFMLGLKLTDPVSGAAWQPMIPIFTTVLAVLAGYEQASMNKAMGLFLAVSGALFMVLQSQHHVEDGRARLLEGQLMFFMNCLATAGYIVMSKELLRKYHAAAVTSWSYLVACKLMTLSTMTLSRFPRALAIVCQDADDAAQQECLSGAWTISHSMVWPLVYWILFGSILAYFLVTWANQHAKASVVSVYAVVQPIAAGLLSAGLAAVAGSDWAASHDLRGMGFQDLGILPIMLGMRILFQEPTLEATCVEATPVPIDNAEKVCGMHFPTEEVEVLETNDADDHLKSIKDRRR